MYTGKRGGGGGGGARAGLERENVLSPFPPLVSTPFLFLQARRPQVPMEMLSNDRIEFSRIEGGGSRVK